MAKKNEEKITFYCNDNTNRFFACNTSFNNAKYVILGVPFDKTSTFRPGARFAPSSIREASLYIESYDLKTGLNLEDIKICDIGDLNIEADLNKTFKRLESVVTEIVIANKIPIIIGGEHIITAAPFQALKNDFGIIIFDAHLDLRDEFLESNFSHATFVRRLVEQIGSEKVVMVGTRAVCKEEIEYAQKIGLFYIPTYEIQEKRPDKILEIIRSKISNLKNIYVSLDMDVLDPAFAPAVANPEGNGLNMSDMLNLVSGLCDESIVCFDLTEVSPHYDQGITSIQAANIISKVICNIESHRIKKNL